MFVYSSNVHNEKPAQDNTLKMKTVQWIDRTPGDRLTQVS